MKGWRSADEECGRHHRQPQIYRDIFQFYLSSLYDSSVLGVTTWEMKERYNEHDKATKVNYTKSNLFTK